MMTSTRQQRFGRIDARFQGNCVDCVLYKRWYRNQKTKNPDNWNYLVKCRIRHLWTLALNDCTATLKRYADKTKDRAGDHENRTEVHYFAENLA